MSFTVAAAVFLGSSVEFVEALTIVLAVGATRSYRISLLAAASALVVLTLVVILAGPWLVANLPMGIFKAAVGLLLLLFGIRWLRKAVLRASGFKARHDEGAAYEATVHRLSSGSDDRMAFATSFNAVFLECLEVAFIVLTVGVTGSDFRSSLLGAAGAFVAVGLAGVIFHAPLKRIPENALKFCVGILLSTFGVFWLGEGIGARWPGQDLSLLLLLAAFSLVSWWLVRALEGRKRGALA